jgi:hypothetical protein
MEDMFLDVLDDQPTPEELTELQSDTDYENNDTDSIAAAFSHEFESTFSNRFVSRLSNGEGKDE